MAGRSAWYGSRNRSSDECGLSSAVRDFGVIGSGRGGDRITINWPTFDLKLSDRGFE
jgi:hypothetical protein